MKLHHALPLLAMASAEHQQQQQQHHRRRLDRLTYQSLASPNQQLLDALSQDGIVSITGIPNFKDTKRNLMTHLHACLMDMEDDPDAVVPTTQYLRDGTVRRSIATATLPSSSRSGVSSSGGSSGGSSGTTMVPQPLHDSIPETTSCTAFKQHADSFRAGVDMATDAFAERLSLEMGPSLHSPVMSNEDGSKAFDTIHQLVEGGEHLEHFHSYQKNNNNNNKSSSSSSSSGSSAGNLRGEEEEGTISLHTDQGFFIAFTPGLIVSHNNSNGSTKRSPDLSKGVEMSDGFYVEDAEGHRSLLQFEDEDDLVFMMGDGANQYINNRLLENNKNAKALHAAPHALSLTPHDDSLARVWYGRMVLPPKDAYDHNARATYGDIRRLSIDSSAQGENIPMGIGCSSSNMQAIIHDTTTTRNLDGTTDTNGCTEDELFCWFRCQPLADFNLTVDTCADQRLLLQCTSPRDQVVPDGKMHGDYYPGCTNSTAPVTPYPLIEQQDNATCPDLWEEFAADNSYDHVVDISNPEGDATHLMWSVMEDGATIKARLAFNNIHGFLAMGFANEIDTVHNGMNGGNVIMAIPGSPENYSAETGLVLDDGPTVHTYTIDTVDSAFRHWQDSFGTGVAALLEATDCFTAISFESDNINGKKFNVSGTDEMIWAGNAEDHFVGYHGHGNRRRFTVDWKNGQVMSNGMVLGEGVVVDDGHDHDEDDGHHDEEPTEDTISEAENANSANGKTFLSASMLALASMMYMYF